MKKSLFIIFLLLLGYHIAFAQKQGQKLVDSLITALSSAKEDTNKVNILNGLSQHNGWMKGNYDTALYYAQNALKLSKKLDFNKGKAVAYSNAGIAYWYLDDYNKALKYHLASLKINKASGDKKRISSNYNNIGLVYSSQGNYPEALKTYYTILKINKKDGNKREIANNYFNIGTAYNNQGNRPEALKNYFTALKIFEAIGDKSGIALTYNSVGTIYDYEDNFPEALKNYTHALKIYEEIGDKGGISGTFNNIGGIYCFQENFSEALNSFYAALKINEEIGNKSEIARNYNNIGLVYQRQGNLQEALNSMFAALKINEEIENKNGIALDYGNIGNLYIDLNKAKEGRMWIQKSIELSREINAKEIFKNAYRTLAKADSALGNFKNAYESYKMYIVYRDSLYNEENTREIAQTAISYEYDKREALAAVQYQKNIEKTRIWFGSASIIALLLAILGFSLFYLIRAKKRKAQQLWTVQQQLMELKQEEAERELQSAKQQMDQFLKKINEKNNLIERISTELNILKESQSHIDPNLEARITELRNIQILTNDDWMVFLSSFNKLYPSFTQTLKEKCPKITPSELRYLMLTKIGLLHKEMANVLGVSPDTIRVTWNRVRNKLNGTLEDNPMELLSRWVS